MAGLGSTGRKLLESCLDRGVISLPVPMAVLEHWHGHASGPDSECGRATGCGGTLTLHRFVWCLLRAWPGPGCSAVQPTPKEPGGSITEAQAQAQICGSGGNRLKRRPQVYPSPYIGSHGPDPTTGHSPQSALLGLLSLLLPPTSPAWVPAPVSV